MVLGGFGATEAAGATVVMHCSWAPSSTATIEGRLIEACRETVRSSAAVMFIVGCAALFAWVADDRPRATLATDSCWGCRRTRSCLLLIVNVLLLCVGMIMESIAAILIIAPIVTPALMAAGVDPVCI